MRFLRETKASSSRAVSLLGSVRFCHFTTRVDGAMEVLESLRVKGLAAQLYSNKKPWRPSDVLSVGKVEFLHRCFADKNRSEIDRIFIGHLLHMLYSRSRFSDLLAVAELFLDDEGAFLEVSATLHKGARNMDAKSKLLPIVASAKGIWGENWAREYLQLRRAAGLRNPKDEAMPRLLSPHRLSKTWDERYITLQEMHGFIKKLFASGGQANCRPKTDHTLNEGYRAFMVPINGSAAGASCHLSQACDKCAGSDSALLQGPAF